MEDKQIVFSKAWLFVMPGLLLVGFLILFINPKTQCIIETMFNRQCGFCGGTLTFKLFHELNWGLAFKSNPLVFISLFFFWPLGLLFLLSYVNTFFKRIFNYTYRFLNKNFLIVFWVFIILYLVQFFFRIIIK